MRPFSLFPIFAAMSLATPISPPNSASNPLRLWYTTISSRFNTSLPLGNGRLGAMIYGDPLAETISTNEDSFWSGTQLNRTNPDSISTLATVRELLLTKKIPEAEIEAAMGLSGTPTSMTIYQPGGDLRIKMDGVKGNITDYERWLDLSDGTAGVYFTAGNLTYKREYLASYPDDVVAIHLTASQPASLNFRVKFERPGTGQNRFADASWAEKDGDMIFTKYSSPSGGSIKAVFGAKVKSVGGMSRTVGDNVQVKGADEAWIYYDTRTTVRCEDPEAEVRRHLGTVGEKEYGMLREKHVEDYMGLFERAELSLGKSSEEQKSMETGERREAMRERGFDPEFLTLYFQFGRFLLISSSRMGTLPANLQGIWCDDLNPDWGSKFTININLQMNYWPSQVTNLQDLNGPLWSLIESIHTSGLQTAKAMYNTTRGWIAHHNTDIWGDTAPQDIWAPGTYWPLGGVWLISHMYEHYRYTLDKDFLAKYYYLFYDAAEFFDEFLTEYSGPNNDGSVGPWMLTNPSVSPENSYVVDNLTRTTGAMTVGSTLDNTLLRELFDNLLSATTILSKPETELIGRVKSLRERLPPLKVSERSGRLMEWIEDYEETEPGHRHMSHLYGLFPGNEITQGGADGEGVWEGAKKALAWRVKNNLGNMGWSLAWTAALHARVHDGASVESDLHTLLVNSTHDSLLDSGDPAAFQIDGNFGGTAAIAESLIQSHITTRDEDGKEIVNVHVLPALMPSAKDGIFRGLLARGGSVIGAEWEAGLVKTVSVESKVGGKMNVTAGAGQKLKLNGGSAESAMSVVLDMEAGKIYTMVGEIRQQ